MATAINEKPRQGFVIFEDYEIGKYIHEHEYENLRNYLAGHPNAYWNPNRAYFYQWYNECNNLYIVMKWQRSKGFAVIGKYGERICSTLDPNSETLIDLADPKFKNHSQICYRCSKIQEG